MSNMRGWLCILFISVSILANGQTINIDTETNTRMLARYAETEAILAGMAVGAKEEASLATKERSMADSLMNYSVERMFDYAPGLLYRADEWLVIEAKMVVLGKAIKILYEEASDTMFVNTMKELRKRFVEPNASKTIPGDVVWRDYLEFFHTAEKTLVGTDKFEGIMAAYEQVQGFLNGEIASGLNMALSAIGDKQKVNEEEKPLFETDFIKDRELKEAYRLEVENILDQVVQMHRSWVPSADKRAFYEKKKAEILGFTSGLQRGSALDFLLESEKKGRPVITEDYERYLNYGKENY